VTADRPPLRIPCEGSGAATHFAATGNGLCAMCGRYVRCDADGRAVQHDRDDVLAMIRRGDYDA